MNRIFLGDVAKISSGGTPDRSNPAYWGGSIPWVKTGEIQFGIIRDAEEKITKVALENSSAKLVPAGSLLMAMYGQGKTRGQVALLGIDAAINQACAAILPQDAGDSRYLFQYLAANYENVRRLSNSGSQENLNAELIRGIPIYYPAKPERQRIADILGKWDEALEKLDALIAAKARRQQALMQQLLTGSLRFKAFKKERWQTAKLSEILEQVARRNSSGCQTILTGSAEHGLIDQREFYSRRVASHDVSNYYLVKRGEFAYNRSSAGGYPFGATKRLDDYDEGVLSTLYLVFRIREGASLNSNFLKHAFEGGVFNHQLSSLCREGARSHGLLNITADEFFSMRLQLPGIEEQKQIESVLTASESEIELLQEQRAALDRQKRGLMQRLLTGKIRVKI